MRIRITLVPQKYPASMPANTYPLAAFIYNTIAIASPQLAQFLHDEGLRPGTAEETDRRFKFFVFAQPDLPRYRFEGEYKCFEEGFVQWQISSPLPEFIETLIAGLAAQESVQIARSQFSVLRIEIMPPPTFNERMRFMALSPVTVARSNQDINGKRIKHYLRANEEGFGDLVVSNLLAKYYALTEHEIDSSHLHFEFDEDYIQRAGGYESRKITRLIRYGDTEIKSVFAPYIVSGNVDLIRLGWECGFGSSNSQGFGMAGI